MGWVKFDPARHPKPLSRSSTKFAQMIRWRYLLSYNILSRSDKCFLGSSTQPQPRRPHGFWRKICSKDAVPRKDVRFGVKKI